MRLLKGLLLPALLLATAPFAAAKDDDDQPQVSEHVFDSHVGNVFYFDDSEVVVLAEETGRVWRSTDSGKSWEKQKHIRTIGVIKNPFDKNVAVAVGEKLKHWITFNQGEDWTPFETEHLASSAPISYHATDPKKIIFNTIEDCFTKPCLGNSYYTEDGFKTEPKILQRDRKMCLWAKSSERLLMDTDKHDSRVLCIVKGKFSVLPKDLRLVVSDNYFKDEEEPPMAEDRTISGMTNMAAVKGYLVAAAKSEHSKELALYVTDDTVTWHRAEFADHKIEEDAYTILESTNYSIQVDVQTSRSATIGSLFTSNSNGTYFTKNIENTNRNRFGYVDFEKIANIQGIVIVNTVDNPDEVENPLRQKKIKSHISFDDGRTFETIKAGDKELHLHSVTNLHNSGRVFSSPAPGLVMGVGNTGEYLKDYRDGDLYVSDDAGLTWTFALKEAHKYEFGDQGSVLVAVYDEGETDTVMYSLKHGRPDTWEELKLKYKFRAHELTTLPDSTSLKFIIVGEKRGEKHREPVVIYIDFSKLLKKCEKDDFIDWNARVDEDEKPICVMGQEQSFRRRKWDAKCFVGEEFKDPVPKFTPCKCDEVRDYECDFNFEPDGSGKDKKCNPTAALTPPEGACKGDEEDYEGSSGWRKIPGNQCEGKTDKDKTVKRPCNETKKPVKSGKITNELTRFKGQFFRDYYYLERGDKSKDDDETVVMLTSEREAFVTHDHGKNWKTAVDEEVIAIYPHQYTTDYVYFVTPTKTVYYSKDRARGRIHHFETPTKPNLEKRQFLSFHPNQPDWLIWMGSEDCKAGDEACHSVAYASTKNGHAWDEMLPYVKKCSWIWREEGRMVEEKLVFCEQYENEEKGSNLQLISSEDLFEHKEVIFPSVVEFATMSEFIIVASKAEKDLKVSVSLDGKTFAEAKFPPKFKVDHQTAYTVLDSSTHAIFLHVTVNPLRDQEYGTILKSNSNGTSYVLSLSNVNRNTDGYVDFEKMQGIEGVALANIVANKKEVDGGSKKKLKTVITHNDGADWLPLKAPKKDSDGKPWGCDIEKLKECSLNLHGYTERGDPRETFSSPSAVGVMMAIGNVGEHLDTIGDASTFITTDAGISWTEVKKGSYIWEYGDQGSVIVIVRRGQDTNHIFYTKNNGKSWERYDFAEKAIRVDAITTLPSDMSLNFLLWGKDGRELVTVNIDFRGVFDEECKLDDKEPEKGDYEFWTPEHPMLDDDKQCLFGHVARYHRRRTDRNCYNGRKIDLLHDIERNCSCTRRDFECDYNYERRPDGSCVPIAGLSLPEAKAVCNQKGVKEYWDITGYRKIPISTCTGGAEMEHLGERHPCPGYEDEYQKKHGTSGFIIFLSVVIPFVAAGGIGYWVWKNWDGKFGRIRLGDAGDSEQPWVKYPVLAVSALAAVIMAIPALIGSLVRVVRGRMGGRGAYTGLGGQRTFNSRSSFARGAEYAAVDPDEGELLGDESEEDV